jgi:predicted nucleic acid-binding protein
MSVLQVVDSCGWLSYFAADANAAFFAPAIEDTANLLVPWVVAFEVSRRLLVLHGPEGEAQGLKYLKLGRLVGADFDLLRAAAYASRQHALHMGDSLIWQTAQAHGATLWTQDAALSNLVGVRYTPAPGLGVGR